MLSNKLQYFIEDYYRKILSNRKIRIFFSRCYKKKKMTGFLELFLNRKNVIV